MANKHQIKKTPAELFLDGEVEAAGPDAVSNGHAEEACERLCGFRIHPAAAEFPMLPDDELEEMVESIAEIGQTTPVVVDGDTLLEGRNRARTVEILQRQGRDIELRTVQWQPTPECRTPSEFIGAANLCRRHLTDDQRALLAARLVPHIERELADRQKASRIRHGEKRNPAGVNQHTRREPSDTDSPSSAKSDPPSTKEMNRRKWANSTRGMVAKNAGVSHHKADMAVHVARKATQPQIEAVMTGKQKLPAVHREIREKEGSAGSAAKKTRRTIVHAFMPMDDFEEMCLRFWVRFIAKEAGLADKSRAREVFREIFRAEEEASSSPKPKSKKPANKNPSEASRGRSALGPNGQVTAKGDAKNDGFSTGEHGVHDDGGGQSKAGDESRVELAAAANSRPTLNDTAIGPVVPANLWGRPLPGKAARSEA